MRVERLMNLAKCVAVVAICAVAATGQARAQVASAPPSNASTPGWSFAITPYAWLPTISSNLQASGPRGGTVNTTISAGIGDYLSDVNFGVMLGGVARYDRFSIMTDLLYMNLSLTTNTTHLSTVNLGPGPINIPRSQQLGTGTRLAATVWSLAGGYTVLQGEWGNLDAVAGLRMLALGGNTNYQLTADIMLPDRTIALTRGGTLNYGRTYFNAIGGITGRINIPNSKFYLPFYLDAGGGALPLTWQVYAGVAYSITTWADVSAGYRYLTFRNGGSGGVRDLSLSGAILTANLRF